MNKMIDVITFAVQVIGIGFGFQVLFLTHTQINPFITVLIPLGFAKIWWDTREALRKEESKSK